MAALSAGRDGSERPKNHFEQASNRLKGGGSSDTVGPNAHVLVPALRGNGDACCAACSGQPIRDSVELAVDEADPPLAPEVVKVLA